MSRISQRFLDTAERTIIIAVFSYFAVLHGAAAALDGVSLSLFLLVAEGAVLAFVLVRRHARSLSANAVDWTAAALGTMMPLLARPADVAAVLPLEVCGAIMVLGILLQVHAKLSLRRSFGIVAANRGVVINGPYRLVRHPMYLGYLITHVGFLLYVPTLWNVMIYTAALTFQMVRILAEERLLLSDPGYRAFHQTVRYRLLPGVY